MNLRDIPSNKANDLEINKFRNERICITQSSFDSSFLILQVNQGGYFYNDLID